MDYRLLDSGDGCKLEQFGQVLLIRPAPTAFWKPRLPSAAWRKAHARFSRERAKGWEVFASLPEEWTIHLDGVRLRLKRTDFGHLGVFAEHATFWPWMRRFALKGKRVLNLFAYSGGATCALALEGAQVTHLDASKGMVQWARENAELNHLQEAPIRWIVDDVRKYLARAVKRHEKYDAIILDPPSFGRGKVGEIFKIEHDLPLILQQCRAILSDNPLFVLLTCHTPSYTPIVMHQLVQQAFSHGEIQSGEMYLEAEFKLPSGTFAQWKP
ncbi:MAG: Ribosomal RNA large subunit methyltransferase K [Chlamydiales bacterium]|nr:Ribosomal RNA large subunit methyltransferase K [Chlamydiales bacterium]